MIDIHSHILPKLDDGPRSVEDSLAMARAAVEDGITQIIATPYHLNNQFENSKQQILAEVASLNEVLREHNIDLTVLPGQEVRICGDYVDRYIADELLTLVNGYKYILIEFPSNHVPRYAEKLFFDIQLQGLIPIIVHPERNTKLISEPGVLHSFVKSGVLTQVTAGSLTGAFGKKIKKFSEQLISHHLTHFIATDAHNTTSRGFLLRRAYEEVEKKFGIDMVYQYQENSQILIEGGHVFTEAPEEIRKKRFLNLF